MTFGAGRRYTGDEYASAAEEAVMTIVTTALSMSVDGYIAGPDNSPEQPLGTGGERLFEWFGDGPTRSRFYPSFHMAPASAAVFDDGASRVGAIVAGRRTYDISNAWNGGGPMPGIPLFVLTHSVPTDVPAGDPPYTFITDGIEAAVAAACQTANGKDVALMGASIVQQAARSGLLDE